MSPIKDFLTKVILKSKQNLKRDLTGSSSIREIGMILKKRGRIFDTDTRVMDVEKSIDMPVIKGHTLEGTQVEISTDSVYSRNKVTVVKISCSQLGTEYVAPYKCPEDVLCVNVHLVVGRLKGTLLYKLIMNQLTEEYNKKIILDSNTKEQIVVCKYDRMGDFEQIGAVNRYGGYVYLVDQRGKARWRACGEASNEDLNHFKTAIDELRASRE